MKRVRYGSLAFFLPCLCMVLQLSSMLAAEQVPLKRVVELALSHATAAAAADAAQERALSSYHEVRDQYLPSLTAGSGLGKSWGYPLSLEGSAPSIVNTTAQSALFNPALREFVHAAKTEWQASEVQSKDQREQVLQDAVLSYAELSKWEALMSHLTDAYARSLKMEEKVNQRVREGIDSPLARTQARLSTARVYLRVSQAQGSIDVLRQRLSQMTGLPAASIETLPDSIPALPQIQQSDDLIKKALGSSPTIQVASLHTTALEFRARGEHRSMWPTFDFAAQYALLSTYNNYQDFFQKGSFQRHNATIGVAVRFPFFSPSQRARASGADAELLRARKDAEGARNRVSEQTLTLQRSVEQLAAAREVADLEYQVSQSNLDAVAVRVDSGTATLHDEDDAQNQANDRYNALQDANFDLQRARIALLRATGDLAGWLGMSK